MDKNVGRLMKAVDDLGIAENTVLIFLSVNGTDRGIQSTWGEGKKVTGGKGTMTDRGTRVPMFVRWPNRIKAGSVCKDLIDFSDFLPTLCDLGVAPLPEEKIHGISFFPQLLGQQGTPREWVHIQDKEQRYIRDRKYILTNKNELRKVVEIWQYPAKSNENIEPEKEQAARKKLQAVFDSLDTSK